MLLVISKFNIISLVKVNDCVSYKFNDNTLDFDLNNTVLDYFVSFYQNTVFFLLN